MSTLLKLTASPLSVGVFGTRTFATTSWALFPRAVRDKLKSVADVEAETVSEDATTFQSRKWKTFMSASQLSQESENKIHSTYGSIRMDVHNLPQYTQEDPVNSNRHPGVNTNSPNKFGTSYVESSSHGPEANMEAALFEQSSEDNALDNVRPFQITPVPSKDKQKKTKRTVRKGSLETNKVDLNYFDELTFKDSYAKFNSLAADQPRQVAPPSIRIDEIPPGDLNEIDTQYLVTGSCTPDSELGITLNTLSADQLISKSPVEDKSCGITSVPDNLDFIDQQFFSSPFNEFSSQQSHHSESPHTENKICQINTTTDRNKENVKKRKSIIAERVNHGPRKPSPALEYVKNLRKMDEQSTYVDPVNSVGVGVMARLSSAVSPINANVTRNVKEGSGDKENGKLNNPVSKFSPPDLKTYTSIEVEEMLAGKVLYNDHEIVALWKPYGLPMFCSTADAERGAHSLERYLPSLAKHLEYKKLHEIHRLDSTTTGVVLLAVSEARRKHLKQLMAARQIVKTYYAITNGVPNTREGVINIPIGEGHIDDRYRPTLRPDYKASKTITNKSNSKRKCSTAVTDFRVLSSHGSAALVECIMLSGVKHQIRVHLGFALGTPILGDNKYSYVDRLGPPQRVKGDIVHRLGVRPSQTRHLPIYLHAKRISIPSVLPDNTQRLTITANKPHFFNKTEGKLKLHENRGV